MKRAFVLCSTPEYIELYEEFVKRAAGHAPPLTQASAALDDPTTNGIRLHGQVGSGLPRIAARLLSSHLVHINTLQSFIGYKLNRTVSENMAKCRIKNTLHIRQVDTFVIVDYLTVPGAMFKTFAHLLSKLALPASNIKFICIADPYDHHAQDPITATKDFASLVLPVIVAPPTFISWHPSKKDTADSSSRLDHEYESLISQVRSLKCGPMNPSTCTFFDTRMSKRSVDATVPKLCIQKSSVLFHNMAFAKHNFKPLIVVKTNRGRDIYPFFLGCTVVCTSTIKQRWKKGDTGRLINITGPCKTSRIDDTDVTIYKKSASATIMCNNKTFVCNICKYSAPIVAMAHAQLIGNTAGLAESKYAICGRVHIDCTGISRATLHKIYIALSAVKDWKLATLSITSQDIALCQDNQPSSYA